MLRYRLPLLAAVVLALATRQVNISLFVSIRIGGWILTCNLVEGIAQAFSCR